MVEGCQATGLSHLLQYMREYNGESHKQPQGRKRFNYIAKTKYIAHLGIIYLCVRSSIKKKFSTGGIQ